MSDDGGKPTTVLPERKRPGLFEAYGVEIELMIVDARDARRAPGVRRAHGAAWRARPSRRSSSGRIAWSNELTLHVLELKTNGPARLARGAGAGASSASVRRANARAGRDGRAPHARRGAPVDGPGHRDRAVAARVHRGLPHLRPDLRLLGARVGEPAEHPPQPPLPRTTRSSGGCTPPSASCSRSSPRSPRRRPTWTAGAAGALDARLVAYRGNARRVPSVTGLVVPEPALTQAQYETEILGRIYRDLAPLDPEGVLRHEWANARGAIARFDRGTVEIRVIDAQECPSADVAVVAAVSSVVRALAAGPLAERDVAGRPGHRGAGRPPGRDDRERRPGGGGPSRAARCARAARRRRGAPGDVWRALLDRFPPDDPAGEWTGALDTILAGRARWRAGSSRRPGPHRVGRACTSVWGGCAAASPTTSPSRALERSAGGAGRRPSSSPASTAATTCRRRTGRSSWARTKRSPRTAGGTPAPSPLARCAGPPLGRSAPRGHRVAPGGGPEPLGPPPARAVSAGRGRSPREREALLRALARAAPAARSTRTSRAALAAGRRVLHLGVHTFTPALDGSGAQGRRGAPLRSGASGRACPVRRVGTRDRRDLPELALRRNQPYRGASDGLTTWLRARHGARYSASSSR